MDLKLEKLTNDIAITSGDVVTIKGLDEAAQRIKDRLLTFRGEWFLNLSFGVDYIGKIMVKNPRNSIISAHIRSEILKSVSGKITSFTSTIRNRVITVEYGLTIDGESITDEVTL